MNTVNRLTIVVGAGVCAVGIVSDLLGLIVAGGFLIVVGIVNSMRG